MNNERCFDRLPVLWRKRPGDGSWLAPLDERTRAHCSVVEDNLGVAQEIKDTLGNRGHRIIGPVSTIEGAFEIATGRPDVVTLDVGLAARKPARSPEC